MVGVDLGHGPDRLPPVWLVAAGPQVKEDPAALELELVDLALADSSQPASKARTPLGRGGGAGAQPAVLDLHPTQRSDICALREERSQASVMVSEAIRGLGHASARVNSTRWVSANLQGQCHGVAFSTRSGELRVWSTGSGMCAWCGPNRWGRAPGRKSQMSARPLGRRTRPISARPAAGSAQWCIDRVLTTRSNDRSGKASAATSPTRNEGRRWSPFSGWSALAGLA